MAAYLLSDEIPVVLFFSTLSADELVVRARQWIADGKGIAFRVDIAAAETAEQLRVADELGTILINFGSVAAMAITAFQPASGKKVAAIDAVDIESL